MFGTCVFEAVCGGTCVCLCNVSRDKICPLCLHSTQCVLTCRTSEANHLTPSLNSYPVPERLSRKIRERLCAHFSSCVFIIVAIKPKVLVLENRLKEAPLPSSVTGDPGCRWRGTSPRFMGGHKGIFYKH